MIAVGIIGASGFTGAELLRICANHPSFEVVVATGDTQVGNRVADLYPSLAAAYPETTFASATPEAPKGCDLVFLGLPHGASQELVPAVQETTDVVIDLGADFRLRDPDLYPIWYGEPHKSPELLAEAAYGLPELFGPSLDGARLVAAPGCYPTAAALALAPFLRVAAVENSGLVVDAASGVSGAGRTLKETTAFCVVDEDFSAYGLLDHRHTPEIEQALATSNDGVLSSSVSVLFTPHLVPMNRGILATCYARPTIELDTERALSILADAYEGCPFVVVDERSPSTKSTLGSNTAHLTARVDPRTGLLIVLCAIDNLGKGASGQAVQCANIILGLDETTGLTNTGLYP
jgi:N-acetyl-gamma-glutamyl-phosphate reductase